MLERRRLLSGLGASAMAGFPARPRRQPTMTVAPSGASGSITLFLCGDVMLGRGIDQILSTPSDPRLHEPVVQSAKGYVALAERANGRIPKPVDAAYVWGDALAELERAAPHARIVNLETSITTSDQAEPKGINYRMHPKNVACLAAAKIDCCALANNHVLDWGRAGLTETLATLDRVGIRRAGAGVSLAEAAAPAILEGAGVPRILVFAYAMPSSGVPESWAARSDRAGVRFVSSLSDAVVARIAEQTRWWRLPGDISVASLHWGANWGYAITAEERRFAHRLVETAGFDVLHGHSPHHPKAIEVYRNKLILYGCGDFLNDYEGIGGEEQFRPDLVLMYLPRLAPASGDLLDLALIPLQIRRFQLARASSADGRWLRDRLDRESGGLGAHVGSGGDGGLLLQWARS